MAGNTTADSQADGMIVSTCVQQQTHRISYPVKPAQNPGERVSESSEDACGKRLNAKAVWPRLPRFMTRHLQEMHPSRRRMQTMLELGQKGVWRPIGYHA